MTRTRPDAEVLQRIGEAVRTRREKLGLTHRALAKTSGIGAATIIGVEEGRQLPIERTQIALESALRWRANTVSKLYLGSATDQDLAGFEDPEPFLYSSSEVSDVIRTIEIPCGSDRHIVQVRGEVLRVDHILGCAS